MCLNRYMMMIDNLCNTPVQRYLMYLDVSELRVILEDAVSRVY